MLDTFDAAEILALLLLSLLGLGRDEQNSVFFGIFENSPTAVLGSLRADFHVTVSESQELVISIFQKFAFTALGQPYQHH